MGGKATGAAITVVADAASIRTGAGSVGHDRDYCTDP